MYMYKLHLIHCMGYCTYLQYTDNKKKYVEGFPELLEEKQGQKCEKVVLSSAVEI